MSKEPEYIPAKFIETPHGDLIAPSHVASVRYWPPSGHVTNPDHRTQLETIKGAIWELYRGPSEQAAKAARDAMKAKIDAALSPPAAAAG
jgi:hypothetical protein